MVIDVHVHIGDERMVSKKMLRSILEQRRKVLSEEDFKKIDNDRSVERLIRDMDEAGVDRSVCLPSDLAFTTQEEMEVPIWKFNEYVAEAQARFPDRIIGFFGCDPMRPGAVDMLEKGIKELGLKGVKILPGWFYPTHERVAPYIQKIEELNIPVLFHSGLDPLPFVAKYCDPMHLDDLLLKYPKLKIVAAHYSRGWESELVQMMYFRPGRIWTDISGMQKELTFSRWHFLWLMRYFLDRCPSAILFGSDWPMIRSTPFPTEKEWVEAIRNMELPQACLDMGMKQFTEEEKENVLGGNAQKLLNI